MHVRVDARIALTVAALSFFFLFPNHANAACTTTANTVTCTGGPASHVTVTNGDGTTVGASTTGGSSFPSTLAVTGGTSVVTGVTVTLHGWTSVGNGPGTGSVFAGLMLVSPDGRNLELMNCVGTGSTESNLTLTVRDGSTPLPSCSGSTGLTSGTFAPGSYYSEPNYAQAGAPTLLHAPQTEGTSTLTSAFSGGTVNGNWNVYLVTDPNDAFNSDMQFSSWDIAITYATGLNTTTSVSTSATGNETTEGTGVTLTATVSSGGSSVSEGTVTFTDRGTPLGCSQGNPRAVSNGSAQCSTTFSSEGAHSLLASYNGDANFNPSSGTLNLFVDHATTNSGAQYCNAGGISIAGSLGGSNNAASPYPSHIDVTGFSGNITGATLTLNGFTDANPEETAMLLEAPTGANIVPWNDAGGATGVSGISFTLADAAGAGNTIPSPPVTGETYLATAETGLGAAAFPAGTPPWAPPGTPSYAAPEGTQTLNGAFSGISPDGYWSLYVYNRTGSTALSATSWCITLLQQPTMSVGSSHTGSFTQGDAADTYAITVRNNGPVATTGDLTLADTLPMGLSDVSFVETGHTGGGTGSDWSCTGTNCTRTSAMASGEQDTLTLTVGVGFNTATGTNAVTNTVGETGGNASNSPTANDATTVNPGQVQVTVDTSPAGLAFSVNGTGYSSQQTLTVTNGSAVTLATTTPQTLTSTQYVWTGWSDGGGISHTATVSSATGTASFVATYPLTTAASPATGGTVSPASGTVYDAGTVAPVTATPNAGWVFTGWTGAVANPTSASTTVTMNAAESVTANFAPDSQPIVFITNGAGGLSELTDSGAAVNTTLYPGGNGAVAVDATGNVWSVNAGSSVLYETNQLGTGQTSIGSGAAGLNAPAGIAVDGANQIWVTNGNGSVSEFTNAGAAVSPGSGYTDSSLAGSSGIAVDLAGSVWVANTGNNSVTRMLGAAAPAAPLATAGKTGKTGTRP
jgi:uncharacterized repeat protein (TIGR02543 family)